ncbi:glycosyltransferase [Tautonia sp. JC769]|uniref:glycosyltransferase n=1 Tax=Tautonia sp. JC769 TaxID=3232135 RepID=UPI00345A5AC5
MNNLNSAESISQIWPVRVCYLIDRLGLGGTEGQLLEVLRRLDRSRVKPALCLLNAEDDISRSLEPDHCPVLRLGVHSLRHPSSMIAAIQLARFLRRKRVDILQVHFPDSTYFGVPVARLAGVPRVVRTRRDLGYWMTPRDRWLGRLYNRWTDATLTNAEACRRSVIEDEEADPAKVLVMENGIDLTKLSAIAPLTGGNGDPQRVGLVANLRDVKDPGSFVRAAALVSETHPNAKFVIAGEGPLRGEVERLVADLRLGGCLQLLGSVHDVPTLLGELRIAVLCSRSEGMSNSLLESMAAGRAIVATAVGGNVELIADGQRGLLVPPGNPEALAAAIDRLLSNAQLAARLGAAARLYAQQRHDIETKTRELEMFYGGLMHDRLMVHGPPVQLTTLPAGSR